MVIWDNSAFDKHASEIVQAWNAGQGQNGASLNQLVEKIARDNSLSPEHIRRLSRVTNVVAFETKKASAKKGDDISGDFTLVNEDEVISTLHKTAAFAEEKTAAVYPSLDDEMAEVRGTKQSFEENDRKYAMKLAHTDVETALGSALSPTDEYWHLQKTATAVREKVAHAKFKYNDALNKLAHEQSFVSFKRDLFEKDALATCGPGAIDVINSVRGLRGVDKLHIPMSKMAALMERIVGTETPNTKLVKQAMESLTDFVELNATLREINEKTAKLRELINA